MAIDVFLSHSSRDADAARTLRAALDKIGLTTWAAPDDVVTARPWAEQITDAVEAARLLVVLISAAAYQSDHVAREVAMAVARGLPVLPVRLADLPPTGSLRYLLQLVQRMDAYPGGLDRHADAVAARVKVLLEGGSNRAPVAEPVIERPTHRLPLMPTSFLGRRLEIGEIGELLNRHRLVTLTGPGGTGKTRLGLQVAAENVEHFSDGACFVSLAALTEDELVTSAIASALGIRESAGQSLIDTVNEHLATRQILLVVDNLEHLPGAAPKIRDLLDAAPRLRVLATSRSPLHLSGEQEFPVPPLGLPAPADHGPARLAEVESVGLFSERARLVNPTFLLTDENATAVAALVTRLDGLPLAIELAAARTKILSPAQILDRLERRLPALASGAKDAPARQRTLAAAIAWSHDLLPAPEQALYRRFSVFAGGATIEALDVVVNPDAELGDTLDLVGELVDHSLLRRLTGPEGQSRIRMLTVLREDAETRLASAAEAEAFRERHARWCLALAEDASPRMTGPDQVHWLDTLGAEHDNIRAALTWSLEAGDDMERADIGLRIARSVWRFWYLRGHLREGLQRLRAATSRPGLNASSPLAWALAARADLEGELGDRQESDSTYRQALASFHSMLDDHGVARVLNGLGVNAWFAGDYADAREHFTEALTRFRPLNDQRMTANVLSNLGYIAVLQGRRADALEQHAEALRLRLAVGEPWGVANSHYNIAIARLEAGEYGSARASLLEALTIARSIGDEPGEVEMIELVAATISTERPSDAVKLWAATARLRRDLGLAGGASARERIDRFAAVARDHLSDDQWQLDWSAGETLTLAQAMDLATGLVASQRV